MPSPGSPSVRDLLATQPFRPRYTPHLGAILNYSLGFVIQGSARSHSRSPRSNPAAACLVLKAHASPFRAHKRVSPFPAFGRTFHSATYRPALTDASVAPCPPPAGPLPVSLPNRFAPIEPARRSLILIRKLRNRARRGSVWATKG